MKFIDNDKILVTEIPIDDMNQKVEIISNKEVDDVRYIDEFGVFEGVLAESEIRKMYEIGRPFEFPNALSKRLP